MKPKLILATLATTSILLGLAQDPKARSTPTPKPQKPVTVFFLRHGEAGDRTHTQDPELAPAGLQRAKTLVRLLGNAGVTHVFATDYKRTQMTVTPLAKAMDLKVKVIGGSKQKEQIAALKALPPGSVAVVAGHSNTVPPMVVALGGKVEGVNRRGLMSNKVFDRMFMVILPTGRNVLTQTVELRYGEPSGGR